MTLIIDVNAAPIAAKSMPVARTATGIKSAHQLVIMFMPAPNESAATTPRKVQP